jgi:hypothetical protein
VALLATLFIDSVEIKLSNTFFAPADKDPSTTHQGLTDKGPVPARNATSLLAPVATVEEEKSNSVTDAEAPVSSESLKLIPTAVHVTESKVKEVLEKESQFIPDAAPEDVVPAPAPVPEKAKAAPTIEKVAPEVLKKEELQSIPDATPEDVVPVPAPVPDKAKAAPAIEKVAPEVFKREPQSGPAPQDVVPVPAPAPDKAKAAPTLEKVAPEQAPAPAFYKTEPTIEEVAQLSPVVSTLDTAGEPGLKKHPALFSDTYLPRSKALDETAKQTLSKNWGEWNFTDPKADSRPKGNSLYVAYPNRDVPRDKFPANAWQIDPEYLSKFLPEAKALVERALEAILSEYGHGKLDEPRNNFAERSKMFSFMMADLKADEKLPKTFNIGGWTTERSFAGLARRILHSIMTEDTFTLVMGGHSSAAGHGNHFQQSYTMQFQKSLEPIFSRLGVKLTSHNIGMGGMGTIQNALAAGSIYGKHVDILMWDSGMTEKGAKHLDLFARQAILGFDRVPVLWGGDRNVLKYLYKEVDADVGEVGDYGAGYLGIPKSENATQVETIPWATRYIDCSKEFYQECRKKSYMGKCWYDRPDVTPLKQNAEPGGRAKWHPGNRYHQLKARIVAFPVLRALDTAISMWMEADDYTLLDDDWHVTGYYENIRAKLKSLDNNSTGCFEQPLSDTICKYPIQGRTEFTPRANPAETSIRSIIKTGCAVPEPKKNVYDPPDVHNPNLDVPTDAVDLVAIVENGIDFVPNRARADAIAVEKRRLVSSRRVESTTRDLSVNPDIAPGQGWGLNSYSAPNNCDGTYDSFCGRDDGNQCLLYGHNDNRGGLYFDGYSGWLIMNLKDVQHGLAMIKIEDYHNTGANKQTQGWKCENNESDCASSSRRLENSLRGSVTESQPTDETERRLKTEVPPICDDFHFDFAIDGRITIWNRTEWEANKSEVQRVVHIWTLLDDPDYTGGKKKDVELAIRQRGCGRSRTFLLTHVYWA